jgi:hypothetical protein
MSVRKFSTASILSPAHKGNKLWDQTTFQSGMFAIATVSLTSTASSIVFSGIPSNYTHLQIRSIQRTTTATGDGDPIVIQLNSDTGNNYAWHMLQGYVGASSAANTSAVTSTNNMYFGYALSANNSANMFSASVTDILDYANTSKYKTIRTLQGADANSDGGGLRYYGIRFFSGLWQNTNAISTITITAPSGSFAQYSHFALYGIKVA